MKRNALTQLALCPDAAAVSQHNVLNNSEPEPRASRVARTGFIYTVEALEYPFQMFRGNAGPEILNSELNFRINQLCADPNALSVPGVLH